MACSHQDFVRVSWLMVHFEGTFVEGAFSAGAAAGFRMAGAHQELVRVPFDAAFCG